MQLKEQKRKGRIKTREHRVYFSLQAMLNGKVVLRAAYIRQF